MQMDDDIIDHGVIPVHDISTRVRYGSVIEMPVEKITGLTSRQVQDSLAVEEPLEIQLGYGPARFTANKIDLRYDAHSRQ